MVTAALIKQLRGKNMEALWNEIGDLREKLRGKEDAISVLAECVVELRAENAKLRDELTHYKLKYEAVTEPDPNQLPLPIEPTGKDFKLAIGEREVEPLVDRKFTHCPHGVKYPENETLLPDACRPCIDWNPFDEKIV
jgi:regulator of replication initiation timing